MFNPSSRSPTPRVSRARRRGNQPSRTFVWLEDEDRDRPPSVPAGTAKVKFPSDASWSTVLDLIRRELPCVRDTQSITFYKAAMTGNHRLMPIGCNLGGQEICDQYRTSKTKVYLGRTNDAPQTTLSTLTTTTTTTMSSSIATPSTSGTYTTATTTTTVSSSIATPSTTIVTSPSPSFDELFISRQSLPIVPQVIEDDTDEAMHDSDEDDQVCEAGPIFHGSGIQVGVIKEDASDRGIFHPPGLLHSSLVECIRMAQHESGTAEPTFLPFTFKAVLGQAHDSCRGLVIVLICSRLFLKPCEKELLSHLADISQSSNSATPIFWLGAMNTEYGKDASDSLGGEHIRTPQVIVCSPSLGQAVPTIIERFVGAAELRKEAFERALQCMGRTLEVFKTERLRMKERELLLRQQKDALEASLCNDRKKDQHSQTTIVSKMFDTTGKLQEKEDDVMGGPVEPQNLNVPQEVLDTQNEEKIRRQRKERVCAPPEGADIVKIAVRGPDGKLIRNSFSKHSCFQMVYDWAGSMAIMPLHFSLHRAGGEIVRHDDQLKGHETLNFAERDHQQSAQLLGDEVSFCGNFPMESPAEDTLREETVETAGCSQVPAEVSLANEVASEVSDTQPKQKQGEQAKRKRKRGKESKKRKNHTKKMFRKE
ncbi:uncharacterized protein LOC125560910 isoform X2 [Nematostella vectensis]|uniref:uncharacterized protein LOC125560910 isoform X2 n=2 Tax=Nematostella vectensis TaxID=45351 RepID=UPI0020778705|nr:uncharacterized protein LOC125560910 isoform X2 [Nematostella vectensis]